MIFAQTQAREKTIMNQRDQLLLKLKARKIRARGTSVETEIANIDHKIDMARKQQQRQRDVSTVSTNLEKMLLLANGLRDEQDPDKMKAKANEVMQIFLADMKLAQSSITAELAGLSQTVQALSNFCDPQIIAELQALNDKLQKGVELKKHLKDQPVLSAAPQPKPDAAKKKKKKKKKKAPQATHSTPPNPNVYLPEIAALQNSVAEKLQALKERVAGEEKEASLSDSRAVSTLASLQSASDAMNSSIVLFQQKLKASPQNIPELCAEGKKILLDLDQLNSRVETEIRDLVRRAELAKVRANASSVQPTNTKTSQTDEKQNVVLEPLEADSGVIYYPTEIDGRLTYYAKYDSAQITRMLQAAIGDQKEAKDVAEKIIKDDLATGKILLPNTGKSGLTVIASGELELRKLGKFKTRVAAQKDRVVFDEREQTKEEQALGVDKPVLSPRGLGGHRN